MTEAFDTSGTKINPVAQLVEIEKDIKHKRSTWGDDTPAQKAENERWRKWREDAIANAPYFGWPKPTPMFNHVDPKVNAVAKILWESGL